MDNREEQRYILDHDYHIHSVLSICARDERQTPQAILQNGIQRGLKELCLTDHYWDERVPCNSAVNRWYERQGHDHVCQLCPLPQAEGVRFLFGCEADMDSDDVIGISPSRYNAFDFIVVATTHFHHTHWGKAGNLSNKELAKRWVERFDAVLNSSLPFGKVGIAHLACSLINRRSYEDYLETLSLIPQQDLERLFYKAARLGLGIELNWGDMEHCEDAAVIRIFRTAKLCGCKFYLGSDAHTPEELQDLNDVFERAVTLLDLKESDKFVWRKQ